MYFMHEFSSCVHQPYHIFLMGFQHLQMVNSASNWYPFSDQGYKYLKPPSTAILCIESLETDAKLLKQTRHILRKCSTAGDSSQEILDLAKIKQFPIHPKSDIDTQNDGLEKVVPFEYGHFWYLC